MKLIKLTQNKTAIIDDIDYEIISKYKWYARKDRNTFYAQRKFKIKEKWKNIMMHRFIMNPLPDMFIDHINRDGLDNQRKNLRIVTHSQNHFNEKIRSDNISGTKGVSWNKKNQKWIAILGNKYLGSFHSIEEAKECRKYHFNKIQWYKNNYPPI